MTFKSGQIFDNSRERLTIYNQPAQCVVPSKKRQQNQSQININVLFTYRSSCSSNRRPLEPNLVRPLLPCFLSHPKIEILSSTLMYERCQSSIIASSITNQPCKRYIYLKFNNSPRQKSTHYQEMIMFNLL